MLISPRMKWKINRYKQRAEARLEELENFFKSVTYKQKMCPACRALVDRKEKICPLCGNSTSAAPRGGIDRLLSSLLPKRAQTTSLLLGVNLFLFALTWVVSIRGRTGGMDAGVLLGSIDGYTLVRFGAKYTALILDGEWWRLLAPIFLHGGLIHLGFNSIVLFDLGPTVEDLYGPRKFLVLYILAGAMGFVASALWHPHSVGIGASGAIFGLIGAMIAYGYRHRGTLGDTVKNMYVRWAIYGLVFGFFIPMVDNAGHIGGLAAGAAFGMLVGDMPSITRESIYLWKLLQKIAVILIIFSFVMVALRQPA